MYEYALGGLELTHETDLCEARGYNLIRHRGDPLYYRAPTCNLCTPPKQTGGTLDDGRPLAGSAHTHHPKKLRYATPEPAASTN